MNIEVSKSRWTSRVEFFYWIFVFFELHFDWFWDIFFLNQLNGIGKKGKTSCLSTVVCSITIWSRNINNRGNRKYMKAPKSTWEFYYRVNKINKNKALISSDTKIGLISIRFPNANDRAVLKLFRKNSAIFISLLLFIVIVYSNQFKIHQLRT